MKRFFSLTHAHDDQGWTLAELSVVVLIMGILLAIAIAVYTGATSSANAAACRENQNVMNRAISVARAGGNEIDELADLESNIVNFERASVCPSDATPLEYDPATDTVTCPNHP